MKTRFHIILVHGLGITGEGDSVFSTDNFQNVNLPTKFLTPSQLPVPCAENRSRWLLRSTAERQPSAMEG